MRNKVIKFNYRKRNLNLHEVSLKREIFFQQTSQTSSVCFNMHNIGQNLKNFFEIYKYNEKKKTFFDRLIIYVSISTAFSDSFNLYYH